MRFYYAAFTMTAFTDCKLTSAFSANGMLGLNAPASCLLHRAARRQIAATINATAVTIVKLPNYANRRGLSFQGTMYGASPSVCRNLTDMCTER